MKALGKNISDVSIQNGLHQQSGRNHCILEELWHTNIQRYQENNYPYYRLKYEVSIHRKFMHDSGKYILSPNCIKIFKNGHILQDKKGKSLRNCCQRVKKNYKSSRN